MASTPMCGAHTSISSVSCLHPSTTQAQDPHLAPLLHCMGVRQPQPLDIATRLQAALQAQPIASLRDSMHALQYLGEHDRELLADKAQLSAFPVPVQAHGGDEGDAEDTGEREGSVGRQGWQGEAWLQPADKVVLPLAEAWRGVQADLAASGSGITFLHPKVWPAGSMINQ